MAAEHRLDSSQADVLAAYLHDLGVILHFQDDPLLQRVVILKPEWGTNAVYAVLDTKAIQENNGRFCFGQLALIWSATSYPPSKHAELLQLMIRFELCYRLENTDEYIAPELLSAEQPTLEADDTDNLQFEYRYTFMPAGMLTRFIVRNHSWIQDNLCWKNGVVLARDGSRATVTAVPYRSRISIRVSGRNKRDVLATIRHDFQNIHKSLNNPELDEMVPCICSGCVMNAPFFFRYAQLRGYSENGIPEIRCEHTYKSVSVEQLLTGVYRPSELDLRYREAHAGPNPASPVAQKVIVKRERPNAWTNGSFALLVFLLGCVVALVVAQFYSPWLVPVVILSGIMALSVVGAFQLRHDNQLSEARFLKLMAMSLRQLPALLKKR